jgi:alanine dehydrogenase
MTSTETILINSRQVAELLTIEEANAAVEKAFELYATGQAAPPGILGIHASEGGFHIKAGILNLNRNYFVSKMNANFPGNPKKNNLPTIQGVIIVCDADNGRLLALMDSIELTIIRTGAATAVAAKYLSGSNAKTITICGCGNQGKISLRSILKVRTLEKAFVYDIDKQKEIQFADQFSNESHISIEPVKHIEEALMQSDICVTCTPSRQPFIIKNYIKPGTFIAAVGADSEDKQELNSELLSASKVVTDLTNQAAMIGELHHAIKQGIVSRDCVYAELGEIVARKKQGRETDEEIIVFDSTGMALQDVATAAIVYEKAIANKVGIKMDFA